MALILQLESSTTVCSVAVSRDGELLALRELNGDYTHAENLTRFIEECVTEAGIQLSHLDAIAVSKGPGSYTGLRIGVSTAKGLCYALNKPLIAIGTLQQMAHGALQLHPGLSEMNDTLLCPMIDARRMEVYCALYTLQEAEFQEVNATIIDEQSFQELLANRKICFFGDGAEKCRTTLGHPNAVFLQDVLPSAKHMVRLSEVDFKKGQFEDLAYFEPYYLKDFVAGKKKSE
jgi:tRNA threonylcarbamoyladenosine biosynthesis protein TsaB